MSDAPSGYASQEERGMGAFRPLRRRLLFFVAPLIALKVQGDQSPIVLTHATKALNFQITWGLVFVIAFIIRLCSLGVLWFLPILVWLFIAANCVIGGLRANEVVATTTRSHSSW